MTEINKLNLSAMMHSSGEKDVNEGKKQEEISESNRENNIEETKNVKKSGLKINLSSIKSDKKPEPIKEIVEKPAEIKDEKTLYYESLTSRVIQKPTLGEDKIKDEKKLKITALKTPINKVLKDDDEKTKTKDIAKLKISALKEPVLSCKISEKEKYIQKKSEEDTDKIKNIETDSGEVFHNYESEFKKKETSVLDAIAKIKAVAQLKKLSKTNKIFLASIIGLTIVGVGFIFHIDPNTHSLDNYKASILTLAGKEMSKQEVMKHQGDIQNEIAWKLEENNLGGYNLGFEILVNENGDAVYKFDGKEYQSKEFLDLAIAQKLEMLKKEKILDYFKIQKQNNLRENNLNTQGENIEDIQDEDDIDSGSNNQNLNISESEIGYVEEFDNSEL